VIPNPDLKGTPLFDVEYLRNDTRQTLLLKKQMNEWMNEWMNFYYNLPLSVAFVYCILELFPRRLVFPYRILWQYSNRDPYLGQNWDFRPISGFEIDDWWSVVNNFDRGIIYSSKRRRLFIAQTVTMNQRILFMPASLDRHVVENRTEFNRTRCCYRRWHEVTCGLVPLPMTLIDLQGHSSYNNRFQHSPRTYDKKCHHRNNPK